MTYGFAIFRKMDEGQELHVVWRADREATEKLVEDQREMWRAHYGVREAAGRPAICATPQTVRRWVY